MARAKGFVAPPVGEAIVGRSTLAQSGQSEVGQDDAQLIAAVARRDASAFRTLAERHAAGLHRLAWRLLADASEAEDVVQESLLRMWDHAAAWKPVGGGVPAWLRRIATNLCLDRLRRRARMSDEAPPDIVDDRMAADQRIDADRLGDVARRALAALPDRQRAAVVLTYYEQLSNAAAAELMEMKLKAFESLLVRARTALRAAVGAAGVSAADLESIA